MNSRVIQLLNILLARKNIYESAFWYEQLVTADVIRVHLISGVIEYIPYIQIYNLERENTHG